MAISHWAIACFALIALMVAHGSQAAPAPTPVIIDTDIGDDIDDAFALALALASPKLEVVGVTAAWGDTQSRVWLIRRLLAAFGRNDIPVAQGIVTKSKTPFSQMRWAQGALDKSPAPDAVSFIREQVMKRPGEITLLALAPMTNLEALIKADPAAFSKLRGVALMGGSITAGYNHGGSVLNPVPSAEYNIAMAPSALRAVLGSGVPVTMFPLDSTQIKFDEVRRDRLFAYGSPSTDALALLYHQWRLWNEWGQITPTLFDSAPVAWVADPQSCTPVTGQVIVDEHGFTRLGEGRPNASICMAMRPDVVLDMTINLLTPKPAVPK